MGLASQPNTHHCGVRRRAVLGTSVRDRSPTVSLCPLKESKEPRKTRLLARESCRICRLSNQQYQDPSATGFETNPDLTFAVLLDELHRQIKGEGLFRGYLLKFFAKMGSAVGMVLGHQIPISFFDVLHRNSTRCNP